MRVTRNNPCPICHKADWCGFTDDGAVRCMRIHEEVDGWRVRSRDGEGGGTFRPFGELPTIKDYYPVKPKPPAINWDSSVRKMYLAMTQEMKNELSDTLGVSPEVIRILGVGWCEPARAFSFPMYNGKGKIIGIRLRNRQGKKLAIRGSRAGVFCAANKSILSKERDDEPIVVCEGPTDVMAIIELGFWGLGRPSCSGGSRYVREMCGGHRVVLLSDADGPGREGAARLANELVTICPSVKVIEPLFGKDAREWKASGVNRQEVELVYRNTREWSDETTQVQGRTG